MRGLATFLVDTSSLIIKIDKNAVGIPFHSFHCYMVGNIMISTCVFHAIADHFCSVEEEVLRNL